MKSFLLNLSASIIAVFAPVKGALATVLVLIIIDLITGVIAARKAGIPITSSGIKRTVIKLLIYEVSIALAFLTQTYLTGESIPCTNIVAGLVGLTELMSVLENLNKISGGELLKSIIDKLGKSKDS